MKVVGVVMHGKPAKIRLYHGCSVLSEGDEVILDAGRAHYVRTVMRAQVADSVLIFCEKVGEWQCVISSITKKSVVLQVTKQLRSYVPTKPLTLCIGLVKNDIMRNVVRQATELGITNIQVVKTERCTVSSVDPNKCRLWAIEAAEQCCRMDIPKIEDEVIEFSALQSLGKKLVCCDESGEGKSPTEVLRGKTASEVCVVVGPEGGFSDKERELATQFCEKMSMGTRIMKVDTAVVAALAYVNELCSS